jgi:hypothetical protein
MTASEKQRILQGLTYLRRGVKLAEEREGHSCFVLELREVLAQIDALSAFVGGLAVEAPPTPPPTPPRCCENEECGRVLPPNWPAVYCSNECALADA